MRPLPEGQSPNLGAIPQAAEACLHAGAVCPDCAEAEKRPWGGFSDCKGCRARGVSRLPLGVAALRNGFTTDRRYRELLRQAGLTHEDVRRAHEADAMSRETKKRARGRLAAELR